MSWQNRSLEEIEQNVPQMQFVADCLVEGTLGSLSHLDDLFPASMTFPDKVSRFSSDRSLYYCRMIELQDQAQSDAVDRVHTLRELFAFYATQVLAGDEFRAGLDLEQQQTDVATFYSLSHSFLEHAKALRGVESAESDALLAQASPLVSQQYDRYAQLKKTAKADDAQARASVDVDLPPMNESDLASVAHRFEFSTMKCGNNDVRLAGANLDLFALLAQESYFWQKSLSENTSLTFGYAAKPVADLEHHADLLRISLERVRSYAKRGKSLMELSSLFVSRVSDIQDRIMEDGRSAGKGLPLYLPR